MKRLLVFILIIACIGLYFILNAKQPASVAESIEVISVPEGDTSLKQEIKVDLEQQKAFLYQNGQFIQDFKISSGKEETPTPKGSFEIIYKQEQLFSKIAGCWLSFWAGFTSDGLYGFHETPICNGLRIGEDEIGEPASAGCLRLSLKDAKTLYSWVEIGAVVTIY